MKFRPKYTDTIKLYNIHDKEKTARDIISYMLDRTQAMFHYEGLPETIPADVLEIFLQTRGHVCFTKAKLIEDTEEQLYIFVGGPGGEPDVYYRPTKYVIANPRLAESLEKTIDEDCVVMRNDELFCGLLPIFSKYATLMAENELSMKVANINTRIQAILSADDDNTRHSAEQYLADVEKGKIGIIANSAFLEGLQSHDYGKTASHGTLTDLIEYQQYLKASQFNEIGLDANYNMKRESINSTEAQMNDDALIPLIDDMLLCRQRAVEKINEMFGTSISVELSSVWRATREEIEAIESEAIESDETDENEETADAAEEMEDTAKENEENPEETEDDANNEDDAEESEDDTNNEDDNAEKIEIELTVKTEDNEEKEEEGEEDEDEDN